MTARKLRQQGRQGAFSDSKIIHLKNLSLAMREAQTQFGKKYIMLLATDQNRTLGLCAILSATTSFSGGNHWLSSISLDGVAGCKGTLPYIAILQSHVTIYCNHRDGEKIHKKFAGVSNERNTRRSVKNGCTESQIQPELRNLHVYWQGKKWCLTNICKIWPSYLPLSSTHTVTAIGYIDHYGQEKLVVKLDDGILYQADDNLKQQKREEMVARVNNCNKRKFAVWKVVKKGGLYSITRRFLYYQQVISAMC